MSDFITWLRVELLRLRSFDWGSGSRTSHWLKDGVAKFTSYYPTKQLATKIGISEDHVLSVVDSPSVVTEVEGKSFTIGWREGCITLTWLEEGIKECITNIDQHYYEDDGKYYTESRIVGKIVYLDGVERIISDTGEAKRVSITEKEFSEVMQRLRQKRRDEA